MSYDETEESIGGSMANQLGSGAKFLARGETDIRITTILRDSENNPDSLYPATWLATVNDIIYRKKSWIEAFADNLFHFNIAVRGGGITTILQAEQVNKTGSVHREPEVASPSTMDRIRRRDNVEEYEQQERDKLETL
jgi:hypothetical protein